MAEILSKYSNDFQAEINKRSAANPNDPSIPQLQKLREEKVKLVSQGADPKSIMYGDQPYYASGETKPQTQSYTPSFARQNDNTDKITQIYEEQKKAAVAQLKELIAQNKAKQQEIINNAPSMFQESKNQSELSRQNNLNLVKESIANAGDRGGIGRQDLLNVNSAADKNLNNINLAQQKVINDANQAIADLEASGNYQEAQIVANNAADRLKAIMQDQQQQQQNEFAQAGLTGYYNGSPTLQLQNQLFNNQMATNEYNQNLAQRAFENNYKLNAFDYQKQRDSVADQQYKDKLGLDLRQQSFAEAQARIQNELAAKRISQDEAGQALQWARFRADQDPNSFDNQLKAQQLDMNRTAKENANLNDITQRIDNIALFKNAEQQLVRNPNIDNETLKRYIADSFPDDPRYDNQVAQLMRRYGIEVNNVAQGPQTYEQAVRNGFGR